LPEIFRKSANYISGFTGVRGYREALDKGLHRHTSSSQIDKE
jgi:hypothetical protein